MLEIKLEWLLVYIKLTKYFNKYLLTFLSEIHPQNIKEFVFLSVSTY